MMCICCLHFNMKSFETLIGFFPSQTFDYQILDPSSSGCFLGSQGCRVSLTLAPHSCSVCMHCPHTAICSTCVVHAGEGNADW